MESCHRQSRSSFEYLIAPLPAHFADRLVPRCCPACERYRAGRRLVSSGQVRSIRGTHHFVSSVTCEQPVDNLLLGPYSSCTPELIDCLADIRGTFPCAVVLLLSMKLNVSPASGLFSHWEFGACERYIVNPSLSHTVAALPAMTAGDQTDRTRCSDPPVSRPGFSVRGEFIRASGSRSKMRRSGVVIHSVCLDQLWLHDGMAGVVTERRHVVTTGGMISQTSC